MRVTEERTGSVLVLAPEGRIDASTAEAFEERLMAAVNDGDQRIVVDFAELTYISSAGLRVFLLAGKRLGVKQGKLALCSMETSIRKVFDIAGFSRLFPIYSTRAEAVEGLG